MVEPIARCRPTRFIQPHVCGQEKTMSGDKQSEGASIEMLVAEGPVRLALHPDGVAHVKLARPDASNGLDMTLLKAFHAVLMQVQGDGRVRAMLLTGDGKHF